MHVGLHIRLEAISLLNRKVMSYLKTFVQKRPFRDFYVMLEFQMGRIDLSPVLL